MYLGLFLLTKSRALFSIRCDYIELFIRLTVYHLPKYKHAHYSQTSRIHLSSSPTSFPNSRVGRASGSLPTLLSGSFPVANLYGERANPRSHEIFDRLRVLVFRIKQLRNQRRCYSICRHISVIVADSVETI